MPAAFATTDEYVAALSASNLVPPDDLARVERFVRAGSRQPRELAAFLVREGLLTDFQSSYLIEGRIADLTLAGYVLTHILGTGAMGTAYRARSAKDDSAYVVKIVPRRNVASLKAIAEKVQALKQVRHPRVSALVNIGTSGDRVYLAWPYLEGGQKLADLLAERGPLPPRQAAQIAFQTASGLQPYHERGLFHGLLKTSDILIGADRRARVLDFGVGFLLTSERGKAVLDTMTNGKTLSHGLDTASPEAILDSLARSPAGDRYSLGCILYRCLTGRYPFPYDNPVRKMMAHQEEEPTPVRQLRPEVPQALADVVETLMQKAPQDRYADTGEAVKELQAVASNSRLFAGSPPSSIRTKLPPVKKAAPAEDKGQAAEPPASARGATLWLILGGLAAGLAGGLLAWWQIRS
jgi:serine/threonine-protein kinase